ncbi:peptide/nickel transport system substrate-binding protein [Streptosporangium becharense]|uniref:Peptide/nickel transport system substrate-binding protein n=1 Tax=Streptosporangium becharense TaxID=1816182 RepID=A0A7W9ICG9_9ACTN|nr:ABC transporter substrate-binding protein [Streptosporangium becharense]MBB2912985.1 peptide/nickel transport system substrate-binding protein [Streptosporangium becharense]MBB5818190.1 peptide/nickel transport system substrate-binding protein [Streptosporangium becharense]
MRLARRLATLSAVFGLLTAACSAPTTGTPAPGDAFVIGLSSEFDTLNPVMGYSPDGGSLIYEGLMSREPDLSMKPALAATAPVTSADGKTVTFTLREGVKFHDGRPVTAADVEYTYEALLEEANNSPIRGDYTAIEEVAAPDAKTVVFTLKHPYAPLVQRTTLGVVPKGSPLTGDPPPGAGPYRFVSRTPGDKIVLEGNRGYWAGAPAITRLVLAFAEDDNVRAARMSAGEFDATILPPKAAARFDGQPDITVHRVPSADYRGIMFPLKQPVTGDRTIRRALSLAIDRGAMVDTILAGAGRPAFGPVSPDTAWHNPEVTGPAAGDPEAARKLLQDAGWKAGDDGIRVKDGRRAEFSLMYPAGDTLRKELALAVASDARKVGVDVRLAGLDWDAIEPRMSEDALIMGWGSPYDPDYVNYELFHSAYAGKGFFNPGGYANPKVDELLETGRASGDEAVRRQVYRDFQKIVHDDEVWTYLVFLKHVYVIRGNPAGVRPGVDAHEHATGGLFRDIHTWRPAS